MRHDLVNVLAKLVVRDRLSLPQDVQAIFCGDADAVRAVLATFDTSDLGVILGLLQRLSASRQAASAQEHRQPSPVYEVSPALTRPEAQASRDPQDGRPLEDKKSRHLRNIAGESKACSNASRTSEVPNQSKVTSVPAGAPLATPSRTQSHAAPPQPSWSEIVQMSMISAVESISRGLGAGLKK